MTARKSVRGEVLGEVESLGIRRENISGRKEEQLKMWGGFGNNKGGEMEFSSFQGKDEAVL